MVLPKAKILLVDDEPAILLTLSAILSQEGYDVDAQKDGLSAIQAIRSRHYDLVLTDLKMPKVDGLGVLAEVRNRSPNTVTVMMTGYGSLDSALEAVQLGAFDYLLKPTPVEDLRAAVRRALERKQLSEVDTLYRISRAATSLDTRVIADEVCRAARRVLGISHASLLNVLEGREQPGLQDLTSNPGIWARLKRGETITDSTDGEHVPEADAWAHSQSVASYALTPGIAGNRLICVLFAHNDAEAYEFHASAVRLLQALSEQTALALGSAALFSELRANNSELAAANEKLRELDRLKSQFLNVATHELRTPLTVILGYNTMLAESLKDRLEEDEAATLEQSVAACKRLIRLVNSMLDVSQIESGKMRLDFAPADLQQLISGVVALMQQQARKKEIHLLLELPSHVPTLTMDSERMQQVMINLLHNALKFTPNGGRVTVSVRVPESSRAVEIIVSDTGIGIAPEEQGNIFEEFGQARAGGQQAAEGVGLGLAIARRIVEAHGGSIRVESGLGKGSAFTVLLPVRAAQAQNRAVPA
jgi:signal transduction histidine kinase/DNA-binding response OmpR family regulator